jgi:hypothetical protein
MLNNQTFAFARGYFWGIRSIIRKPHIICAVILVSLIVLHAGTRSEGLIDGCDLVFLAKSKDGDYHREMNSVVFLEWFEKELMRKVVLF